MSEDRFKIATSVTEYASLGLPMGMSVMPAGITCRVCGGELNPHQKVTTQVCSMPNCQRRLQEQRIEKAARHLEARNEGRDGERPMAYRRAGPVAVTAARRSGAEDLSRIAAAVVPYTAQPIAPLPAARRAAFEAHLDATIAKAFEPETDAQLAAPEEHFAGRSDIEPDDPLAVSACCMACQGYCCLLGKGTHAFIGPKLIAYYRHRNPEATPETVRADYLGRLPEVSTVEGCVYQGPKGCVLPRAMRADICNSYRCSGQEHMMSALRSLAPAASAEPEAAPPPAAESPHVVIVALATWHFDEAEVAGETIHRALTITPAGEIALHDDIPLPPLPQKGPQS